MRLGDGVREALGALAGRRGRSLMTGAGVAVGVLALTATVALSATAAAAVSARFDATRSTTVVATGPVHAVRDEAGLTRVRRLNGVVAAGVVTSTPQPVTVRRIAAALDPASTAELSLLGADLEALTAYEVTPLTGRLFDAGHERRRELVALVDPLAARSLALGSLSEPTVIVVNGARLLVVGIIDFANTQAPFDLSVVVPSWVAQSSELGVDWVDASLVVRTRLGAAGQVATEVPVALAPAAPESVTAASPPEATALRRGVEADTRVLVVLLAVVALAMAGLGVSTTMLVSVLERTHEIGVRRAVGATSSDILGQVLLESALLGLGGGTVGSAAGVLVLSGTALYQGWVAVLPPWLLVAGPVLGLVVSLVAGLYPAWRAVRIHPAQALSSGL